MSDSTEKTKQVKLRLPNKEFYEVEDYAEKHNLNRSQAIIDLIRKGLDGVTFAPATKADIAALAITIKDAIENQPIAIQQTQPQQLPEPEPENQGLLAKISKMFS